MEKYYIGFKGNSVVNSKDTIQQIIDIKKYNLDIHDGDGNKLSWEVIDNCKYKESLFRNIVRDRKLRVNMKSIMADRPPYCVAYTEENSVVRIEYFEGHDELKQIYDIRRFDLYNVDLEPDLQIDPLKYQNGLSSLESSIFDDAHKSIIERPKNSKIRYFGRCSETLKEHNDRFYKAFSTMFKL